MAETLAPQVASIANQTAQSLPDLQTSAPINAAQGIDAIIAGAPKIPDVTAAPYASGYQPVDPSQVTLPFAPSHPQREKVNELQGTATERAAARTKNSITSVANLINNFATNAEQRKQTELKGKIVTVMQSEQMINDANAALAINPNDQVAKGVVATHTQKIQSILHDDPTRKQFQKAFNIDFTDMSKSMADPNVKTMLAAKQEVAAADKAGLTPSTPQDKAILDRKSAAELPANIAAPQRPNVPPTPGLPPNIAAPSPQQAAPSIAAAKASPQVQQQIATAAKPQQSTTPYADYFLKSQQAIQANPLYQQQLKQREKMEQLQMQYVYPKAAQFYTDITKTQMQQEGLNNREIYKDTVHFAEMADRDITNAKIADKRDETQLRISAQHTAAMLKTSQDRLYAAAGLVADPKMQNSPLARKLADKSIADANKDVAMLSTEAANVDLAIAANKDKDGKIIDAERQKTLLMRRDQNDRAMGIAEFNRKKLVETLRNVSPTTGIQDFTKGYGEGAATKVPTPSSLAGGPQATGATPSAATRPSGPVTPRWPSRAIPLPIFDHRSGALIPQAAIDNAKTAGIPAVTVGKWSGKVAVMDSSGNVYDATDFKYLGNSKQPTGVSAVSIGATESEQEDSSIDDTDESSEDTGEDTGEGPDIIGSLIGK